MVKIILDTMTEEYKKLLKEKFLLEFENLGIELTKKEELLKIAFGKSAFYTFLPIEILSQCKEQKKYLDATMKFSIYSFLYLSSILYFDKVSDGQLDEKGNNVAFIYLFEIKEYAIRGYSRLFGDNQYFWTEFQRLKNQMFSSACINDEFDKDEESLINKLGNKSILVYLYIVSMQIITKESLDWKLIEKALDFFHKGFQLLDDYEDFEEDFHNNQLNYYHYLLKPYKELENKDFKYIHKFIYVSGIAEKGLKKAVKYLKTAYALFTELNMSYQYKITLLEINYIESILFHIKILLIKTKCKTKLSNKLFINNNLNNAISSSLSFLLNNMEKDYSWEDFMINGRLANNWITGFVVTMLGEFHPRLKELNYAIKALEKKELEYNDSSTKSIESINFLLMAKHMLNMEIPQENIVNWKCFQNQNGGFSTYIDDKVKKIMNLPSNTDIRGWQAAHNCETAVACWIAKSINLDDIYQLSYKYLKKHSNMSGEVPSYWWSDDIYATTFAILAGFRNKSVQYILNRQDELGTWKNLNAASVFYTALALKALIHVYKEKRDNDLLSPIQKGVNWLLGQQYDDGSWGSENILRLPSPEIIIPQNVSKWYFTSFGFNTITDDFKRVFSTSLIHNVLCSYEKYL